MKENILSTNKHIMLTIIDATATVNELLKACKPRNMNTVIKSPRSTKFSINSLTNKLCAASVLLFIKADAGEIVKNTIANASTINLIALLNFMESNMVGLLIYLLDDI